jgi:Kef-type K+ transport system membrane component KefB/mannitol/fructose-specific phosphotransferase system IIA component (Ntr-type)
MIWSLRFWFLGLMTVCLSLPVFASSAVSEGGPDLAARMTTLVIQLGVILFAARLGNMLFEKLKIPGVLGELCAGVVIGPYMLGGIGLPVHGFENGLFAVAESVRSGSCPVSPELYGICSVAAIILLFLVGIETDLKMFVRYSVAGSLVGIGGVVVSFATGDLLGVWLLPSVMPNTSFSALHPACIFLGVMSTATSVSITARILSERKKLDSPEGVTTLAAAVIDDVLGIVMLAVGMGLVAASGKGGAGAGVNWGAIGVIALKAIGIWLGATVFGILVSRRVSSGLKRLGGNTEIAIAALGMALIVGGLFEEAHLAMIIGAYVMGLALSRTDISHMIREKLHPVYAFMVPVFFAVMGMMVNVKMMASGSVLVFGLIYTVVAVVAKLLGCGLPALLCRFNLTGALRVGVGMVPRGEVALIVAGIGRASGLLSDEVFGIAVMMTLLTTVIAPPLLIMVYRGQTSGLTLRGRELAKADENPPITYTFNNAEVVTMLLNKLFSCMKQDGFFTHTLNREEGLHQARKNDLVISITSSPKAITFDCPSHAVSIIRVLMIEVVAEYEQTLSELRKLLDDDRQLRVSPDELSRLQKREKMVRYLSVKAMVPNLKGTTKEEVIAELVEALVQDGSVRDRAGALADVLKREAAMSTGLGHGIACPHARTDTVGRLVCAVGVKRQGVDFGSMDGQPAQVVLLTLCPVSVTEPYMEFQTTLLAVMNNREVYEALLNGNTPGELYHSVCVRGTIKK